LTTSLTGLETKDTIPWNSSVVNKIKDLPTLHERGQELNKIEQLYLYIPEMCVHIPIKNPLEFAIVLRWKTQIGNPFRFEFDGVAIRYNLQDERELDYHRKSLVKLLKFHLESVLA